MAAIRHDPDDVKGGVAARRRQESLPEQLAVASPRATNLVDAIEAARPKVDSALHDDNLDPATVEPLLQVLRRLSDAEQELIVLSIWRELTPAEIGEVLGIPAGTVRVRLHRLRRRVEEMFMQANRNGGAA